MNFVVYYWYISLLFYPPLTLLTFDAICYVAVQPEAVLDPCVPNPCGSSAVCKSEGDLAICECLPGTFGDANIGCRPECITNSECPLDEACIQNKCRDPCVDNCGQYATCKVISQRPICSCPHGYTGDPNFRCSLCKILHSSIMVIFKW